MSQVFLFSTLSGTIAEAYTFVITVSTLAYLIPYLVSPIFQLKLVATGETYKNEMGSRIMDGVVAVIALCYALWVIKTRRIRYKNISSRNWFIRNWLCLLSINES